MGWQTWCVCVTLGARSVRMRVTSSSANVGLCSTCSTCVCANMYFCVWCRNSSSPTNLNQPWVISEFPKFSKIMSSHPNHLTYEKFLILCNSYRKLFKQIHMYINCIFLKFLKTKQNKFREK